MSLIVGIEYEERLKRLREGGVLIEGHFSLSSGRHSDIYLDKRKFMETMKDEFDLYCCKIAENILNHGYQTIVAPEHAGVYVATNVFRQIRSLGSYVEMVVAQKNSDNSLWIDESERPKLAGRCVAVIEDVITTGNTAFIAGALARDMSASFNAIYSLFDRRQFSRIAGVSVHAVMQIILRDWEPPCRLCQNGIPLSPKPMGGELVR